MSAPQHDARPTRALSTKANFKAKWAHEIKKIPACVLVAR
jgi:hypothetical protein